GLDRLYAVCRIARRLVDSYNIGRVIARPFVGSPGGFRRTGNRKDLAVMPPEPTLLDRMTGAGRAVRSIGKIGDIFAHSGTGEEIKADGNAALMQATLDVAATAPPGSL
ncbi:phosphopentomutase, partial [Escherichia coli]